MSELWGFQSGQQQADETNLKMQMGQLALQEGSVDIQQKQVNLKTSELVLQQQQQVMKRLAAMGKDGQPGGPGSAQDPVEGLANELYAQANAIAPIEPEKAASIVDKASRLELNHSKVTEAMSNEQVKMWNNAANALSTAHDAGSLQEAFNQFSLQHPEEAQNPKMKQLMMELQARPYDQAKIDAIRKVALDNKENAETTAAQARAKASLASAKRDEAQVPLEQARTKEAEARTAALRKAGADTALPKGTDVNYVMAHITKDYDVATSDADKASARLQATSIASTAKEIQKANPGMSMQQALDQAYTASNKGGNLSGLKKIDKSLGGSASNPLPLPKDTSKFTENRWYIAPDKDGNMVPQLFDGSTFKTQESLTLDEAETDDGDDSDGEEAR